MKSKSPMNPYSLLPLLLLALVPTTARSQVATLTFNTTNEGFTSIEGSAVVAWSANYGGTLSITAGDNWRGESASLDLKTIPAFQTALDLAAVNGGELKYDIIIPANTISSGTPSYFETTLITRADNYDQSIGGGGGQFSGGGVSYPRPADQNLTIVYSIQPAPAGTNNDGIVQISPTYGSFLFNPGLNGQPGAYTQATYYIDNIRVTGNSAPPPIVIPKVTINPVKPGLTLISSGDGLYDRRMIRTVDGAPINSWVTRATMANPVSLRFSTAELPEIATQGSFIYIIPVGGQDPFPDYNDPDYNAPTCARFTFARVADGQPGGIGEFAYKVNKPDSNGEPNSYFTADNGMGLGGRLATINTTSVIGDWTLKFTSDTDFSITGPDGTTASGTMLQATADLFSGPLHIYFGNVPGSNAAKGLVSRYKSASITGLTTPIVDNFTLPFDAPGAPGFFRITPANNATVTKSVVIPTATQKYWLNWSLPAVDFALEQSTDLGASGPWTPFVLQEASTVVAPKSVFYLLDTSEVSSTTRNFFRLTKPAVIPAP